MGHAVRSQGGGSGWAWAWGLCPVQHCSGGLLPPGGSGRRGFLGTQLDQTQHQGTKAQEGA